MISGARRLRLGLGADNPYGVPFGIGTPVSTGGGSGLVSSTYQGPSDSVPPGVRPPSGGTTTPPASTPTPTLGTPTCVIDYESATAAINDFNRQLRAKDIACDESPPASVNLGRPEDNPGCTIVGKYPAYELAVNEISQARMRCAETSMVDDGTSPIDNEPIPAPDTTIYPGNPGDMYGIDEWEEDPIVVEELPESDLITGKNAAIGVGALAVIGLGIWFMRRRKKRRR